MRTLEKTLCAGIFGLAVGCANEEEIVYPVREQTAREEIAIEAPKPVEVKKEEVKKEEEDKGPHYMLLFNRVKDDMPDAVGIDVEDCVYREGQKTYVKGTVFNVPETSKVAAFIRVRGTWWPKPYWNQQLTSLGDFPGFAVSNKFRIELCTREGDENLNAIYAAVVTDEYTPFKETDGLSYEQLPKRGDKGVLANFRLGNEKYIAPPAEYLKPMPTTRPWGWR